MQQRYWAPWLLGITMMFAFDYVGETPPEGFEVEQKRNTATGTYATIQTLKGEERSFTITPHPPGNYCLRVRSFAANLNSDGSQVVEKSDYGNVLCYGVTDTPTNTRVQVIKAVK